jgi:regulator of protease activity HflC (stomatin/prohibitin superfamily)
MRGGLKLTALYFVPSRIPWIKRKRSFRAYYERNKAKLLLAVLLSLFIIVAFWPWICITVPAGHVAVDWYRFSGGTDVVNVRQEGARFIYPWDKLAVYNTRVQEASRDIDVLSNDGMTIGVNIALRFRVNPATVGLLHKKIGPDYAKTLLLPAVGSYARYVFARNSADEIYTVRRLEIQEEIKRTVTRALLAFFATTDEPANAWVFIDDVLIRGMRFPPSVQSAINRKMEEYQLTREYAYRLERERLESQRKLIEADGIARFQAKVASDLSDAYLRWREIEATMALAQSPNAKIVVIGSSKDGLPIMLGDGVASDTLSARKVPGPDAVDLTTRQSPGTTPNKR